MNDGRTITGKPTSGNDARAACMSPTIADGAQRKPIFAIAFLNALRSSALFMLFASAPINFGAPRLAKTPRLSSSIAQFNAVCPPIVGNTASGFSFCMTANAVSASTGSMYVASAMSGSVIIVAGLEFNNATRTPSSLKARHACVPE